jgi:GTP-binding protein
MFDSVELRVMAGDGGDGAISFRREKFVPYGGPDGGDGGVGGSVIVRAEGSLDSLLSYRHKRVFRASRGKNGGGGRKHGRNGEDIVLGVPPGTLVTCRSGDNGIEFLADLEKAGDEVVVASGGRGGRGNVHYASSTNQAPRIAQRGEAGEERPIRLEMRMIADVGIIGYPNVGKSTLLAAASAARPKIASYPFTTIEPVLGVVEVDMDRFIMAEIPGLIEGAHLGRGLGHDFLQHIMRTKIIIHLISGESESPLDDMKHVNEELLLFEPALAGKTQIVALNKIDLPVVRDRMSVIKRELEGAGVKALFFSAATGQGVSVLMAEADRVLKAATFDEGRKGTARKVFRPKPRDAGIKVSKIDDVYVLSIPELERIITGSGASPSELRWQFNSQLARLGIDRALEKAGAKTGSKIRCGEMEWEWSLPGREK